MGPRIWRLRPISTSTALVLRGTTQVRLSLSATAHLQLFSRKQSTSSSSWLAGNASLPGVRGKEPDVSEMTESQQELTRWLRLESCRRQPRHTKDLSSKNDKKMKPHQRTQEDWKSPSGIMGHNSSSSISLLFIWSGWDINNMKVLIHLALCQ